jgi:hypothetical protein
MNDVKKMADCQDSNPLSRFKPKNKKAFDGGIYLKLYLNKEKALKSIPNWTDKLRDAIDRLIEEESKLANENNSDRS